MWMSYMIPEPLRQLFRCVNCLWPRQRERGRPPLPRDRGNWPRFVFRWGAMWERQQDEWRMQRYTAAQPPNHQNDSASSHTAAEQQDGRGWDNDADVPSLELPRPLSWGSELFYPFRNGSIETVVGKDEDSQPTGEDAGSQASGSKDQVPDSTPSRSDTHGQKPDSPHPQTKTHQPSQAERQAQTLPSIQEEQTNTHDQKPASPRSRTNTHDQNPDSPHLKTNTRQSSRTELRAPTLPPIQEEQDAQPDVTNQRRPRPEMESPPASLSRNSVFEMANLQFKLERVLNDGYDGDTEKD